MTTEIEDIFPVETTIFDLRKKIKRNTIMRGVDMKKLTRFVQFIVDENPTTPAEFENAHKKARRAIRINPQKRQIFHLFRSLCESGELKPSDKLENLMIKKIVRKASGIIVITVLTSPYPSYTKNGKRVTQKFSCGQDCNYCPKEGRIRLGCEITEVTKKEDTFYTEIKMKSNDPIDEVRVITYVTFDDNDQKVNVLDGREFDNETKTFTIKVLDKFAGFFKEGETCTATKIEQPRSYISTEPAVRRANQNDFDAILQYFDRATSLQSLGNKIDKIEILVLGGTWSHYPREYQEEFIRDLYYAANIYYDIEGDIEPRERCDLAKEIEINQTSKSRIIGLTLETRPDCINKYEIKRFRKYGCTRVQLGVQHIDDDILKSINRGCYTVDTIKAFWLLKQNGFKIDCHLMPDLPGSNYDKDLQMFDRILGVHSKTDVNLVHTPVVLTQTNYLFRAILFLFVVGWVTVLGPFGLVILIGLYGLVAVNAYHTVCDSDCNTVPNYKIHEYDLQSPELQADQWKIYPTEVVRWTEIERMYHAGEFVPYAEEINPATGNKRIVDLLMRAKDQVFPWIRLNRVIRDIPNDEIIAGNQNISLRDGLKKTMAENGYRCDCIRCREIRNRPFDPEDVKLTIDRYNGVKGVEYFISYTSKNEHTIYGFCRLRISYTNDDIFFDELKNAALIRELHVYGLMVPHDSVKTKTQHFGFGKKLMATAENIAKFHKFNKVAVISGIGVREYYKKIGYHLGSDSYMMKNI